jgi:WD40 repeat protein
MVKAPYPGFLFSVASGGSPPFKWNLSTGTLPLGLTLNPDGGITGTVSPTAVTSIFTVVATDAVNQSAQSTPVTIRVLLSALQPGAFTPTASMQGPRVGHTATLLISGQILVAGGRNTSAELYESWGSGDGSAELYDPRSRGFTSTGNMIVARAGHTATLLADQDLANYGKVLVAGGPDASAELYDPATGSFATTGSMAAARPGHTATLLGNRALLNHGKVLVVGGGTASAELYDPTTGTFSATGNLSTARYGHTATLLLDGRVLIAGGGTATAELYDPTSGTFTATGSMIEALSGHTATLLADGTVLLVATDFSVELFANGSFASLGNRNTAASAFTASLRDDGTVLVAGGSIEVLPCHRDGDCKGLAWVPKSLANAELFAADKGFNATGSLKTARDGHTATVLADGAVLVIGGVDHVVCFGPPPESRGTECPTVLSSAELFN